jgi:thiol-disulfide isomerase/thioredoxin
MSCRFQARCLRHGRRITPSPRYPGERGEAANADVFLRPFLTPLCPDQSRLGLRPDQLRPDPSRRLGLRPDPVGTESQPTKLRALLSCGALATLALALTGCSPFGGPSGKDHPAVGGKLSDLKLQALTGQTRDLELSDLAGRVVFVHFWGTWCPPCVAEIPHLAEIERTHRDRDDFAFLAISCQPEIDPDVNELREETATFLKQHKLDMPTYADVSDRTRSGFQAAAGWRGYPATMIVDRQGVIRGVWYGSREGDVANMKELVAELLP